MTPDFSAAMRHALELTRKQNLMEATRVIQRALAGRIAAASPVEAPAPSPRALPPPPDPARTVEVAEPEASDAKTAGTKTAGTKTAGAGAGDAAPERRPSQRVRRPLGEVLRLLPRVDLRGLRGPSSRKAKTVQAPDGAAYLARTFASPAGSRDYKVYVPRGAGARALPLIVMLHGCTQDPDDFAVGTDMNKLAEERGFLVAYPAQPASANPSACWNWFSAAHQRRDEGEPLIIAGIVRAIEAEFKVDSGRIYVAGLSAGGAMAAVMSAAYPDLFAAAGVHSGLPYGSASDLPSAFAAMRGSESRPAPPRPAGRVRTIVFHGADDRTVDPSNAEAILAEARASLAGRGAESREDGVAGGRVYRRTVIADKDGVPQVERWAIEGLAHAWSGGRPEGSFTDARGPDASREMVRFFLEA